MTGLLNYYQLHIIIVCKLDFVKHNNILISMNLTLTVLTLMAIHNRLK